MDRGVSMWDVDGAVCLWTEIPQQVILAVSCGPVLPGYVTSSESSLYVFCPFLYFIETVFFVRFIFEKVPLLFQAITKLPILQGYCFSSCDNIE